MLYLSLFCLMWFLAGAFGVGLVAGISNWRSLKRTQEDPKPMRWVVGLSGVAIVLVLVATIIITHLAGNPLQPH